MNKKIIAILGLPGSGKTETIDYLMAKYQWPKAYFGQVTMDELVRRGWEVNEKNERLVREGLRAEFGLMHYSNQVAKMIDTLDNQPTVLLESLYSWEEYNYFKNHYGDNFVTIAIYVSPATRYRRLEIRPIRPLTKEVAEGRDYAQIVNLTQAGPIAMANHTINNEGTLDQLKEQIDITISKILK